MKKENPPIETPFDIRGFGGRPDSSALYKGDYVRVVDLHDPRDEYIEALSVNSDGIVIVCLSDGTWEKVFNIVKYKVQGKERREPQNKLNETYC